MESNIKNPMDLISTLQKLGMFDERTKAMCMDLATDPGNKNLFNEYLEILAPEILSSQMTASPFPLPVERVDGHLLFGKTEGGAPVGLNINNCAHTLLSGRSGCGKSVLFKLLGTQALLFNKSSNIHHYKKIIKWTIAKAPDMRGLLKIDQNILVMTFDKSEKIRINILEPPPGVEPMQWAGILADLLSSMFVSVGGRGILLNALRMLYGRILPLGYYPSLFDLYEHLKRLKFSGYSRLSGYRDGLVNRLEIMIDSIGHVFDCSQGNVSDLVSNHIIFEFGYLPEDVQVIISNFMISYLFHYKLSNETSLTHLVFVDDANLIFYKGYEQKESLPPIHNLLSTVRKSGIHVLAATQCHSLMGSSIHSNAYAQILFSSTDAKDIDSFVKCAGIKDPAQKAYCHTLKPREAIVKFAGMHAFVITIPEVDL